ncbi:MAG TPA: DUF2231 domain-containing protein, partial [Polyangiaceae bacterium]
FTTTAVAAVVYALGGDATWYRIAFWTSVAGVVTGAVAALPGFVDWAFGIPDKSPAKRVGFVHMVLNLVVVGIFTLSAVIQSARMDEFAPSPALTVFLSLVGVSLLLVSGYLGWSLVQTHHVGVDLGAEQVRPERIEPSRQVPSAP